MHHLF